MPQSHSDFITLLTRAMAVFGRGPSDLLDQSILSNPGEFESLCGEATADVSAGRITFDGSVCQRSLVRFFRDLADEAAFYLDLTEVTGSGGECFVLCFSDDGSVVEVWVGDDHDESFQSAVIMIFDVGGSTEAEEKVRSRRDFWVKREARMISSTIKGGIGRLVGLSEAFSLVQDGEESDSEAADVEGESGSGSVSPGTEIFPFLVTHEYQDGSDSFIVCADTDTLDPLDLAVADPICYEVFRECESVSVDPLPSDLLALLPKPLLKKHLPSVSFFPRASSASRLSYVKEHLGGSAFGGDEEAALRALSLRDTSTLLEGLSE